MNPAPAANSAAAPTAPVFMGAAAAFFVVLDAPPAAVGEPPPTVPPPMTEVGAVTPEVNGALETEEAPANATAVMVAVGFAVAVLLAGLRTLLVGC